MKRKSLEIPFVVERIARKNKTVGNIEKKMRPNNFHSYQDAHKVVSKLTHEIVESLDEEL